MSSPVGRDEHRRSFIKAAEVWAPAPEVDELVLVNGHYGDLAAFEAASVKRRFGFDRGLPGITWAARRPIVVRIDDERFDRREMAASVGLTCAISIPVFAGDALTAVLVLFCGDDEEVGGAIEVWQATQGADGDELVLQNGFFGRLHAFEAVARSARFAPGVGVAGKVWQRGTPVLVEHFATVTDFAAAAEADGVEITTAFGFPVSGMVDDGARVVALLSTEETPIARLIEVWEVADDGALELRGGYAASGVDVMRRNDGSRVAPRSGLLGGARFRCMPVVSSIVTGEIAVAMGCVAEVAVPVMVDGRCESVVLFAF